MKRPRDQTRELVAELRQRADMIETIDQRDHCCRPRNVTIMREAADTIDRLLEKPERARIVQWLRSYNDVHSRSALADRIERGEHESFGKTQ